MSLDDVDTELYNKGTFDIPRYELDGCDLMLLTEISGVSVQKLEQDMRPGGLSQSGFIGPRESLVARLVEDNNWVRDHSTSHTELARPLYYAMELTDQGICSMTFNGHNFELENWVSHGYQEDPWDPEDETGFRKVVVRDIETQAEVSFSVLTPKLIAKYGFYEGVGDNGKDLPYRISPQKIYEFFDIGIQRSDK